MRGLIVEDQVKLADYLKRALEEQGYAIDIAHTGAEALEWARIVVFDVIILDIMLPEIDGLSVCRRLRAQGLRTPILLLTARDTVDDRVLGLDSGADDYLVKPYDLKELSARLRAMLRRGMGQPTNILCIADLSMDIRTRVVRRANTEIALTAKEYAVLECLMRNPGRVFTRTEIADSVWNYDSFNQSNVVDVYIRSLRRKIDDPFATHLIQTVRGVGYRLSAQSEEL